MRVWALRSPGVTPHPGMGAQSVSLKVVSGQPEVSLLGLRLGPVFSEHRGQRVTGPGSTQTWTQQVCGLWAQEEGPSPQPRRPEMGSRPLPATPPAWEARGFCVPVPCWLRT